MHAEFETFENKVSESMLPLTGGLPLALVLLASMASSPHISIENLAKRLASHPLSTLAIAGAQPSPEASVRISLEITYAYLLEHCPQATAAFVVLGIFMRPQSTIQILQRVLPASLDTIAKDRIISTLTFHHLITQGELDGVAVWQMHPLLHALAKEYLNEDQPRRALLQPQMVDAITESVAQLRENFQHNQPVARVFDYLKADLMEISIGLLHDGQIIAALNMLESASALLLDAGHIAEYQSWMDRLTRQLKSLDLPTEAMKCVVTNFVNLHNGAIQSSLHNWDRARICWQAVKFCDVDEPEQRQFVWGQIIKARSYELMILARQGLNGAAQMVVENTQCEFSSLGVDLAQQPEWQEALIDCFIAVGDFQAAQQSAQAALALYQASDNLAKTVQMQKTIAEILVMDKNYDAAETVLRQLLQGRVSSLSIQASLHIDLAHVLLQNCKPRDALLQLDQAEEILDSFPEGTALDLWALLWAYRAWGSEQLGSMPQALDQAHKSLFYWRQLPDSEVSQQTMLDLITRAQSAREELLPEIHA